MNDVNIKGPIIIFSPYIKLKISDGGGLVYENPKKNREFYFLAFEYIKNTYDKNGKLLWKNPKINEHKPLKLEENILGIQIAFLDKVIYKGIKNNYHQLGLSGLDIKTEFHIDAVSMIFYDKKLF